MEIILFLCSQDFSSVTSLPLPLGGGSVSLAQGSAGGRPHRHAAVGGVVNLRSPAEPQLSRVVGLH